MATIDRGVLRHPQFEIRVAELEVDYPRAREVIEGAIWSIARFPDQDGIRLSKYDVWQAHLLGGDLLPPVHIYYTFNRRFVSLLTIRRIES
ncbi:MAG: hypothetical protein WD894_10945 [Pirellulales bacterium]